MPACSVQARRMPVQLLDASHSPEAEYQWNEALAEAETGKLNVEKGGVDAGEEERGSHGVPLRPVIGRDIPETVPTRRADYYVNGAIRGPFIN